MSQTSPLQQVPFLRKRKRSSRPSWKDLPTFLDKSATISVSLFASRRLPELKDLQAQFRTTVRNRNGSEGLYTRSQERKDSAALPEDALRSGGAKTSSRHLRRRTTAVERKIHKHRFPKGDQPTSQSTSRKAKRGRQSTLCRGHFEWQHNDSEGGTSKVHWMVTHLWHAKRFHMETLWGWRVPLCHANRGARAMLRLEYEKRCALQDVTWKRQAVVISSTLPLSSLVPLLSRMCPDFANSQAVLAGLQIGIGMLHHLNQFPMQTIGPMSWKVSCQKEAKSCRWIVEFFIHPSICSDLKDNLQEIMIGEPRIKWEDANNISSASCFQLCGSFATSIIRSVLPVQLMDPPDDNCTDARWDWCKVPDQQMAEICLPHGSIFHLTLDPDNDDASPKRESPSPEGLQAHMDRVRSKLKRIDLEKGESAAVPSKLGQNQILLIWQAPRTLNCLPNRAVSGWEMHCSNPVLAKDVWMKLVLAGSCPMGMAEESHLKLECSPPIPMFPRDCVDSVQGRLYWKGNDSKNDANKRKDANFSCNLVRRLWEGGWGRPSIKRNSNMSAKHWDRLVSVEEPEDDASNERGYEDESNDGSCGNENGVESSVVVARGAFIEPFVQTLQGCGQEPVPASWQAGSNDANQKPKRRNRRSSRSWNDTLNAPPLSKQQTEAWKQSCFGLRSSLSLPALLVCHVQVSGKGALLPGDEVFFDSIQLGFVTTASFSLSRGKCHGIAVVGAARLLRSLESSSGNAGCHVRLPDGSRNLQLAVTIKTGDVKCQGSLSII